MKLFAPEIVIKILCSSLSPIDINEFSENFQLVDIFSLSELTVRGTRSLRYKLQYSRTFTLLSGRRDSSATSKRRIRSFSDWSNQFSDYNQVGGQAIVDEIGGQPRWQARR